MCHQLIVNYTLLLLTLSLVNSTCRNGSAGCQSTYVSKRNSKYRENKSTDYLTDYSLINSTVGRRATQKTSLRVVQIAGGSVRGVVISRPGLRAVEAFYGVRYAQADRFRRPTASTDSWTEVRVMRDFGPVCPQKIPDVDQLTGGLWTTVSIFTDRTPFQVWTDYGQVCLQRIQDMDHLTGCIWTGVSTEDSRRGSTVKNCASRTSEIFSATRHVSRQPGRRLPQSQPLRADFSYHYR